MKKVSKIVSVVVLLTFGLSTFTYAETSGLQVYANPKVDVQALLEESSAEVSDVAVDNSKKEKSYTVTYSNGDVNFVKEKTLKNGNIQYIIKDGNITNTIDVQGADLYLDGGKVIYSQESTNNAPMVVNQYENSTKPQASNYSVSDGYSDKYVTLPEPIQNVLKGSIITLIGYINVYVGIAAFVFDAAYTIIKAANPTTTKLYYRQSCWEYSGNNPLSGTLFYKYQTNWYSDSARTQLAESKTSYTMYIL